MSENRVRHATDKLNIKESICTVSMFDASERSFGVGVKYHRKGQEVEEKNTLDRCYISEKVDIFGI